MKNKNTHEMNELAYLMQFRLIVVKFEKVLIIWQRIV